MRASAGRARPAGGRKSARAGCGGAGRAHVAAMNISLASSIAIGLAVGVAIGAALDNVAVGIGIGVALGLAMRWRPGGGGD